jgi:hypothetical protein
MVRPAAGDGPLIFIFRSTRKVLFVQAGLSRRERVSDEGRPGTGEEET